MREYQDMGFIRLLAVSSVMRYLHKNLSVVQSDREARMTVVTHLPFFTLRLEHQTRPWAPTMSQIRPFRLQADG